MAVTLGLGIDAMLGPCLPAWNLPGNWCLCDYLAGYIFAAGLLVYLLETVVRTDKMAAAVTAAGYRVEPTVSDRHELSRRQKRTGHLSEDHSTKSRRTPSIASPSVAVRPSGG